MLPLTLNEGLYYKLDSEQVMTSRTGQFLRNLGAKN